VTIAAAVEWAQQPDAEPGTTVWARRMEAVRGLARFLAGVDPATEVPPLGLRVYATDISAGLYRGGAADPDQQPPHMASRTADQR
jgi:hypothetical protein